MANDGIDDSNNYGLAFGFIYIFNLIVGTGALTLPKAFLHSGIILSSILLVFLTIISFITATFMFESMSIANAIKKYNEDNKKKYAYVNRTDESANDTQNSSLNDDNNVRYIDDIVNEDRPLMNQNQEITYHSHRNINSDFEDSTVDENGRIDRKQLDKLFLITRKFEMGEMASFFFSKTGQLFFYATMILYLYGDLAIYSAAVPKSLRDTTCTYEPKNENETLTEEDPCWINLNSISRMNAYRIYVVSFNLLIGPLIFGNVQKTKLLQMATTLMRWVAFITMISLAINKITDNNKNSIKITPPYFNIEGVPNFFGVCIYAFMCHHSLPSIITPMKYKEKFKNILIAVYGSIIIFYLLLTFTGIFAFGNNIDDFYTLNFLPNRSDKDKQSTLLTVIDYYLSLFPVFTISASFPIIGITLRNNLKSLFYFISKKDSNDQSKNYFVSFGLPLITIIPPLMISLITHDLQLLVGITGSYAGVGIQYIIPCCLVYFGRRESVKIFRQNFQNKHSYSSPFKHRYWVFFVLLWSNISVIFVTVNHIINKG